MVKQIRWALEFTVEIAFSAENRQSQKTSGNPEDVWYFSFHLIRRAKSPNSSFFKKKFYFCCCSKVLLPSYPFIAFPITGWFKSRDYNTGLCTPKKESKKKSNELFCYWLSSLLWACGACCYFYFSPSNWELAHTSLLLWQIQMPAQGKCIILCSYSKFSITIILEFWMNQVFAMLMVLFTVLCLARNPSLYYFNVRGIQLLSNTFWKWVPWAFLWILLTTDICVLKSKPFIVYLVCSLTKSHQEYQA